MSENEQVISEKVSKCVYVDGDKTGFNSKGAIDKFKSSVKKAEKIDIADLQKKYIKQDYTLSIVNETNKEVRFLISNNEEENKKKRQEMLRAKISLMSKNRTNSGYYKAKASNVPDEIIKTYAALSKVSKLPVPEPSEILSKPEENKALISMVINSPITSKLGSNHLYTKYFRLLGKELGIEPALPVPTNNYLGNGNELPNNLNQVMSMAGPVEDQPFLRNLCKPEEIEQVQGNEMSKDCDTDDEEN